MVQTETIVFIVLANILILLLIGGLISFIVEYRKRKVFHEAEKEVLNHQHQKELLQTHVEVQQQTMQAIGREIHDNVGQKLTLASLYAQQIDYENKFPELQEKIASVALIINESLQDLRALSKNLTLNTFDTQNIVDAIQQQCQAINQLNVCLVHFTTNKTALMLHSNTFIVAIRIVQEFLQNSLKHAACKNIFVSIAQHNNKVLFVLKDDGIGFANNQSNSTGIGLKNIEKRAELIGAICSITSAPNKGTTLQLTISI